MATLVDTTAGSSCEVIPTAIASENSSASMIGLCSATLMMKMDVVNAAPIYTHSMENRRSPTWNSVSSLVGAQPGGDLPELGIGAGCRHGSARGAGMHDRADQSTRTAPPAQSPRERGRCSCRRAGTRGQHGLVAFQTGDLHQADVGRDDVAEPQLDEVTGHQRGHIHG